ASNSFISCASAAPRIELWSGSSSARSGLHSLQISVLAKPGDGLRDRFAVRSRAIAKFALRFGRREEHAVLGETQPGRRHKRLAAGEVRGRLGGIGEGKNQSPRQPQLGRRAAGLAGDFSEHVAKEHVLAAENVALADAAFLPSLQM